MNARIDPATGEVTVTMPAEEAAQIVHELGSLGKVDPGSEPALHEFHTELLRAEEAIENHVAR